LTDFDIGRPIGRGKLKYLASPDACLVRPFWTGLSRSTPLADRPVRSRPQVLDQRRGEVERGREASPARSRGPSVNEFKSDRSHGQQIMQHLRSAIAPRIPFSHPDKLSDTQTSSGYMIGSTTLIG